MNLRIVKAEDIGKILCGALGIDANKASKLILTLEVNKLPHIEVRYWVETNNLNNVLAEFETERYTLMENK